MWLKNVLIKLDGEAWQAAVTWFHNVQGLSQELISEKNEGILNSGVFGGGLIFQCDLTNA